MILKRILAENILKYRKLQLTDLPLQGQIAVAGRNEAGKTAIGETICFALFGRTFSIPPDQITKAIRWGEFRGSVALEFTGKDSKSYVVVRRIDNNGKHTARLHLVGEKQPVAEGFEPVAKAIGEVGGFTYKSFIDSFYLAQREMEVPHAKSATVKALIGVDKLEVVATELETESADVREQIQGIEDQIRETRGQVAEITLDRAQLGRLEAECDAKLEAARLADAQRDELAARADGIAKAAVAFVQASEQFVKTTLRTNYAQWRGRTEQIMVGLAVAGDASKTIGGEVDTAALQSTAAAVHSFDDGLAEFDKVRDLADLYSRRLTHLLGEESVTGPGHNEDAHIDDAGAGVGQEVRFADRRAAVLERIALVKRRRRPLMALAVVLVELAALAWIGWGILMAAPGSTVGGWIESAIALDAPARMLLFLFTAIVATVLTVAVIVWYARTSAQLRLFEQAFENIEAATQVARDERGLFDALTEAVLPDALAALNRVGNDLLHSAVVAFAEGDGAVLVQPDVLAAKLDEIRDGSSAATRSLMEAKKRITQQAADKRKQADELREAAVELERQIAVERENWAQVDALERTVAGLAAKIDGFMHRIAVRRRACELIEGACSRIYARFHPELRRFVSKILPRLTEERYQHLELDDDLRVRVFCNKKNDFVGLAEISNGTHRQLMLCVRLALSQALIASSSKSAQFIFFDEPFVFFDEERMARAIDVLGRISPEIKQVWLAAQKFDDPSRFDMIINCDVQDDCLIASGNQARSRFPDQQPAVVRSPE